MMFLKNMPTLKSLCKKDLCKMWALYTWYGYKSEQVQLRNELQEPKAGLNGTWDGVDK